MAEEQRDELLEDILIKIRKYEKISHGQTFRISKYEQATIKKIKCVVDEVAKLEA